MFKNTVCGKIRPATSKKYKMYDLICLSMDELKPIKYQDVDESSIKCISIEYLSKLDSEKSYFLVDLVNMYEKSRLSKLDWTRYK